MALFDGYGSIFSSTNTEEKMDKKYITKENSKKLLNEILLSIKSQSDLRLADNSIYTNKSDKQIHEIKTNSIITSTSDKESIRSFRVSIKKWDTIKWFRRVPQFSITIKTEARPYNSDHEIDLDDSQELIREIYQYLINIEENRIMEETNKKLSSIINDISTTVDKSYRRDETINEILN